MLRSRRYPLAIAAAVVMVTAGAGSDVRATEVSGSIKQVFHAGTLTDDSTSITDYTGEMLSLQGVKVGWSSAEPTIGVDKDGVAFYAAATLDVDRPQVWGVAMTHVLRSNDAGVSWQRVQQSVPATDVSIIPGNADPFVWVDQATGRVFNIDLYAGCSWLNFSDDQGQTWLVNPAACGMPVNDHQTIGAGVPPEGVETVGYPNVVYYCANQLVQTGCGRSLTGGLTWAPTGSAPYPISGGLSGCGGLTGHLRTDPDGRVLLPSRNCVAISEDAGETWTRVRVFPAETPIAHTSVDSDEAGNLYFVASVEVPGGAYNRFLPFLSISRDHGATWSAPMRVAPPDLRHSNFPVVAAGSEGRVAISFPGSREPRSSHRLTTWDHYVVISADVLSSNPTFLSATGNDPADPIHRGACRGRCGGLWDFLDATISPDGDLWATSADDCIDACVTGTLESIHAGDGIAIKQIGGPKLRV